MEVVVISLEKMSLDEPEVEEPNSEAPALEAQAVAHAIAKTSETQEAQEVPETQQTSGAQAQAASAASVPAEVACLEHVTTISGERVQLKHPMLASDLVETLRCEVAVALGVGTKQVSLLAGAKLLSDEEELGQALEGLEAPVSAVVGQDPEIYRPHILYGSEEPLDDVRPLRMKQRGQMPEDPYCRAWVCVQQAVEFPPPQGLNVNMMPFKFGDVSSVPRACRGYWPIIERCCTQPEDLRFHPWHGRGKRHNSPEDEQGNVWYLTIQESAVTEGQSQRRGGVHTEAPGVVLSEGGHYVMTHAGWGAGIEELEGGIYMASNVADSCAVWNCRIKDHPEVVGPDGDLEHLRELLPESHYLEAGELVWFTDTTPHESLPVPAEAHRQFVRVVTSSVSLWYERHSTRNPLGIVPDPEITEIVTHDKFESDPSEPRGQRLVLTAPEELL